MGRSLVACVRPVVWLTAALAATSCSPGPDLSRAVAAGRPPRLDPDYAGAVIPPNIAPLNFRLLEGGRSCVVRVTAATGTGLELRSGDGTCRLDERAWRDLLARSRGGRLRYQVYAEGADGAWLRFGPFEQTVAAEAIDPYAVYRLLVPNKQVSVIRGIFQRHLESFETSTLVSLRDGTFDCVNCHTFHRHDPNRFFFYARGRHGGMVFVIDGKVRRIDTQQGPMFRPLAYASWHPDGRHVAATLNMFAGNFPATAHRYYSQTVEKRGDLVVYDVERNVLSSSPAVFGSEYIETHPCWSADGRSIYYVRSVDTPLLSHRDLEEYRADLMRVAYDVGADVWGEPETVVAFARQGRSCAFPSVSPDGRYLVHVLADHSTYPINQPSSDLYVLDLATLEDRALTPVNSERSESYPRWSSDGRWLSFLSNRGDGRSALPYFAYFDSSGQVRKPFVLPQRDPAWYDTFTDTYNVLELVKGRVEVDPFELAEAMTRPAEPAAFPDPPAVDAQTGATRLRLAPAGAGH